jgi:hypothetical protein
MTDPIKNMLALQKSMLDGWMASSAQMVQYWQHLFQLQENLFSQASSIVRSHVEIDDGPSFTGKYGKRHHDIDPERDV